MKRTTTCEVCFKRKTGVNCLICDRPVCELCAYGRPDKTCPIKLIAKTGPSFGLEGLHWRDRVCSTKCAKRFKKERREDKETMLLDHDTYE